MMRYKQSLLKTAGDVHSTTIGAMERSEESQKADIEFLKYRLENWEKPVRQLEAKFDHAVFQLCKIALQEAKTKL